MVYPKRKCWDEALSFPLPNKFPVQSQHILSFSEEPNLSFPELVLNIQAQENLKPQSLSWRGKVMTSFKISQFPESSHYTQSYPKCFLFYTRKEEECRTQTLRRKLRWSWFKKGKSVLKRLQGTPKRDRPEQKYIKQ